MRKARVEAGLSQARLGSPHFTRAYVSAIELGKIRPAMKSLEFMAGRLGRPVSFFLEDEEQERRRRERELSMARATQMIAAGSAQEAIDELLRVQDEATTTSERLTIRRTLGRAYLEAGDGAKAAGVLSEALRGYEAVGDREQIARTRGQLAPALIALMSYAEAEEHLSEALRASAAGEIRDPLFRVHVLHNLGVVYYQRGNYQAALEQFERAALEGSDIADQKWLASLFAAMGMSRRQLGDYEGAISCLRKSEALFEAIQNRSRVAEIRFQMARTLRALGNKSRAREVLEEAATAAREAGTEQLLIRIEAFAGLAQSQDGQTAQAIERLSELVKQADDLSQPGPRFTARFALAKVVAEVRPEEAEKLLRETASFFEPLSASDDLADLYGELSKVLARRGLAEEALDYARRAYEIARRPQKGGV